MFIVYKMKVFWLWLGEYQPECNWVLCAVARGRRCRRALVARGGQRARRWAVRLLLVMPHRRSPAAPQAGNSGRTRCRFHCFTRPARQGLGRCGQWNFTSNTFSTATCSAVAVLDRQFVSFAVQDRGGVFGSLLLLGRGRWPELVAVPSFAARLCTVVSATRVSVVCCALIPRRWHAPDRVDATRLYPSNNLNIFSSEEIFEGGQRGAR